MGITLFFDLTYMTVYMFIIIIFMFFFFYFYYESQFVYMQKNMLRIKIKKVQ